MFDPGLQSHNLGQNCLENLVRHLRGVVPEGSGKASQEAFGVDSHVDWDSCRFLCASNSVRITQTDDQRE